MRTTFNTELSEKYRNVSQKVRVLTEDWVNNEIFCPNCGSSINHYENNRPVADFFCSSCREEFELKSKKDEIGNKIVDGAYKTMIERLESNNNPNFFFLNYCPNNYEVLNFLVIPKYFFIPEIIEQRKPLSTSARRAGWVGCNILLQSIPQAGKIFYIQEKQVRTKAEILKNWNKTLFLKDETKISTKGWTLDAMKCIDQLARKEFTTDDMYSFEKTLKQKHPENNHVKDKIRQQLQILRDRGVSRFCCKREI